MPQTRKKGRHPKPGLAERHAAKDPEEMLDAIEEEIEDAWLKEDEPRKPEQPEPRKPAPPEPLRSEAQSEFLKRRINCGHPGVDTVAGLLGMVSRQISLSERMTASRSTQAMSSFGVPSMVQWGSEDRGRFRREMAERLADEKFLLGIIALHLRWNSRPSTMKVLVHASKEAAILTVAAMREEILPE